MADRFKVLGQLQGSGSEQTLYTVPSPDNSTASTGSTKVGIGTTQTMVTSLVVCNRDTSSASSFRVRLKRGTLFTLSCTTNTGSGTEKSVIVASGDTSKIVSGAQISGTGITAGTLVDSVTSLTTFSMDTNASGAGTNTLTFYTDDDKEFLFYDTEVAAKKTHVLSLGLTLPSDSVIKVLGSSISFTLMGIEVS